MIANMYFKDTWGRARPAYVNEFGGDKIYTPAFQKSDQCEKNCSWISGEASAAFSFISGTILLKNPIFLLINIFIGFIVSFFRISMGGHFLSDNIFAMFFMIYFAVIYRYLALKYLKNMFKILVITDDKQSSINQCDSLVRELKRSKKKNQCKIYESYWKIY